MQLPSDMLQKLITMAKETTLGRTALLQLVSSLSPLPLSLSLSLSLTLPSLFLSLPPLPTPSLPLSLSLLPPTSLSLSLSPAWMSVSYSFLCVWALGSVQFHCIALPIVTFTIHISLHMNIICIEQ